MFEDYFNKFGIIRKIMIFGGATVALFCFIAFMAGDIVAGILMLVLGIVSVIIGIVSKDAISKEEYEKMLFTSNVGEMIKEQDKLLKQLKDNDKLPIAEKLYSELPLLFNDYIREAVTQPLHLKEPMSLEEAGFLGTMIGGTAVGVAAVIHTKEKQEAYKKNIDEVYKRKFMFLTKTEKLYNCYSLIEEILLSENKTRDKWEEIKDAKEKELKDKYLVTSLWWLW